MLQNEIRTHPPWALGPSWTVSVKVLVSVLRNVTRVDATISRSSQTQPRHKGTVATAGLRSKTHRLWLWETDGNRLKPGMTWDGFTSFITHKKGKILGMAAAKYWVYDVTMTIFVDLWSLSLKAPKKCHPVVLARASIETIPAKPEGIAYQNILKNIFSISTYTKIYVYIKVAKVLGICSLFHPTSSSSSSSHLGSNFVRQAHWTPAEGTEAQLIHKDHQSILNPTVAANHEIFHLNITI